MSHENRATSTILDDLLRRQYALRSKEMSGESICSRCKKRKIEHLHDGRCGLSSFDKTFLSEDQPTLEKIDKALGLMEELGKTLNEIGNGFSDPWCFG